MYMYVCVFRVMHVCVQCNYPPARFSYFSYAIINISLVEKSLAFATTTFSKLSKLIYQQNAAAAHALATGNAVGKASFIVAIN